MIQVTAQTNKWLSQISKPRKIPKQFSFHYTRIFPRMVHMVEQKMIIIFQPACYGLYGLRIFSRASCVNQLY
jgi:hypothetical protein